MALGVYVHIPYCVQRCSYCDFATYEQSQLMPPANYVELIKQEIALRHQRFNPQTLTSLYFGGGTPSLIPADLIVSIIRELANYGFQIDSSSEVTLEINPATVDEKKMECYLGAGVNRFSVGAQTFDDALLSKVGRIHTASQTRQTLNLIKQYGVNFSFDLLFALPGQSLDGLQRDLDEVSAFLPNHISPYCLTIPTGHPLSANRPEDEDQVRMFELIDQQLCRHNYHRYEISNYAQPGFESRHNTLYWSDLPYWGIGLSAHSYALDSRWGTRFWNAPTIEKYQQQCSRAELPQNQVEVLNMNQALTDFCHTSLRRSHGLEMQALQNKFGGRALEAVTPVLDQLQQKGLLDGLPDERWSLTSAGLLISNQVFEALTFLPGELS